jgi:ammonium transporter, Amt family
VDHHREMLQMFADHVGAVIDRAETMERMGLRTRQLEADNLKLNETNRLKDVFLSTASHELRTPLTSVIAYAELLDDNEHRLDSSQRSEFLRRLRSEAERLLGLIEDVLDVSRLESGKLSLRRVPMSPTEVVRTAVETTRSMSNQRGVEIVESYAAGVPEIPIDEVKLRQVVVNLLVNAIKFSPEKGRITVAVSRDTQFVLVEVTDQGPGIRPEDATHIFELFGQAINGQDHLKGGLGIGLHLVKRITELHGGHVGVNTRTGEGSTFWLRLPVPQSQPVEDSTAESVAA